MMMGLNPWVILAIAIIFEVIGTVLLKLSNGFENVGLGITAIVFYIFSFWFFAPALKFIPAGTAYAIWSGIGIALVTLISVLFLGDSLRPVQFVFIALILAGVVGLNLTTKVV